MKIQCDVCDKDEASVYCSADEAALCAACDHRVHHANKLAGKHPRFTLLSPTPKDSPICDICQERRGLVFCRQDRAILCKDCDLKIHKVNEHTQKHNRFLLTGVKLSATSAIYSPSPSPSSSAASLTDGCAVVPADHLIVNAQKPTFSNKSASAVVNPSTTKIAATNNAGRNSNQFVNGSGYGSNTSSISEYLTETLPGWHVEDFLDDPSLFCKSVDSDVMPFWDGDLLVDGNLSSLSSENMGIWVPQAPLPSQQYPPNSNIMGSFGGQRGGSKEGKPSNTNNSGKSTRNWFGSDDGFTVPQISPPSIASKRSRTFW